MSDLIGRVIRARVEQRAPAISIEEVHRRAPAHRHRRWPAIAVAVGSVAVLVATGLGTRSGRPVPTVLQPAGTSGTTRATATWEPASALPARGVGVLTADGRLDVLDSDTGAIRPFATGVVDARVRGNSLVLLQSDRVVYVGPDESRVDPLPGIVDSPLPNSNHVFALTPRPVAVTSITNERGSTSLVFSALDQSGEQTFDFDCPGAKLAAGSTDDIVLLWCPKNGGIQLVEKAGFGANWSYMRFSDDPGEPLMLEAGGDVILIDPNGQIDVFDLASRQIVAEYTREVRPLAAAIDPDSSSIVIATGGGAVADTIWALQPSGSWPGATSVPLSLPISQMAFSGNVAYVLGATYDSSFIGMLDVETGEVTVILDTFGTDLRGDLRLVALR